MKKTFRNTVAFALPLALLAPAAAATAQTPPRTVQPGAPGAASQVLVGGAPPVTVAPHTEADVSFMQGMIPHHQQALEMSALVPSRTNRQDIRLLALRIELSQIDEIKLMEGWLAARGRELPAAAHDMAGHDMAAHAAHAELMPGMLTPEEMASLAAASGAAFDRLFLEFMIRHHEGAVHMVDELMSSPGAAQETEIFTLASHIEADQNIEIARMRAMLGAGR